MAKYFSIVTFFVSLSAHAGTCSFTLESIQGDSIKQVSEKTVIAARRLSDCGEAARLAVDSYIHKNGQAGRIRANVLFSEAVNFETYGTKEDSLRIIPDFH